MLPAAYPEVDPAVLTYTYDRQRELRLPREKIMAGGIYIVRHQLNLLQAFNGVAAHIAPHAQQFPVEIEDVEAANGLLGVAARKISPEGKKSRHVRTFTVNEASLICKKRDMNKELGYFLPII